MSYQSTDSLDSLFLEKGETIKIFNKEEDVREIRSKCKKFTDKTFLSENSSISSDMAFFEKLLPNLGNGPTYSVNIFINF